MVRKIYERELYECQEETDGWTNGCITREYLEYLGEKASDRPVCFKRLQWWMITR